MATQVRFCDATRLPMTKADGPLLLRRSHSETVSVTFTQFIQRVDGIVTGGGTTGPIEVEALVVAKLELPLPRLKQLFDLVKEALKSETAGSA